MRRSTQWSQPFLPALSHHEVLEWLKSYAQRFDVKRHFRFRCKVIGIGNSAVDIAVDVCKSARRT